MGFDWESVSQPFPDPWDVLGAGGSDQSLGTLPWGVTCTPFVEKGVWAGETSKDP